MAPHSKLSSSHRVAVVGGGLLGLTLALRLRGEGGPDAPAVTVYEAAPDLGGLASAWRIGGRAQGAADVPVAGQPGDVSTDETVWDRFYHVILLSDLNVRRLLDDLGLADRLRWNTTRTGFFTDGRLVSMSNSLEFLRFPPLGLVDKLRLGGTIFHASRLKDWRRLEGIAVTDWLRRLSGRHTFEKIWLPLLRAKLGENYVNANAAFIWATISRMYAARRSGLKTEMFGYVDGGYATILAALGEALRARGVEVICNAAVARIEPGEKGSTIVLADGTHRDFDATVMALPASLVPGLCPGLALEERQRLSAITYHGIVCASVLLKRPLGGYYVTNITDEGLPYTAVIEMTALVDRERFGGHTLAYLPRYLTQIDPFWELTDAEVEVRFRAGLARMYPHLRPDDIVAFQVARARNVMALPTLNYSTTLMPAVETSRRGLFLVSSAQIPDGTLNVNETIGLAERAVPKILAFLAGQPGGIPLQPVGRQPGGKQ